MIANPYAYRDGRGGAGVARIGLNGMAREMCGKKTSFLRMFVYLVAAFVITLLVIAHDRAMKTSSGHDISSSSSSSSSAANAKDAILLRNLRTNMRRTTATTTMTITRTPLQPAPASTPQPTQQPTALPTFYPTVHPTISPTLSPTISPTLLPTTTPTATPTISPTLSPTTAPTTTTTTTTTTAVKQLLPQQQQQQQQNSSTITAATSTVATSTGTSTTAAATKVVWLRAGHGLTTRSSRAVVGHIASTHICWDTIGHLDPPSRTAMLQRLFAVQNPTTTTTTTTTNTTINTTTTKATMMMKEEDTSLPPRLQGHDFLPLQFCGATPPPKESTNKMFVHLPRGFSTSYNNNNNNNNGNNNGDGESVLFASAVPGPSAFFFLVAPDYQQQQQQSQQPQCFFGGERFGRFCVRVQKSNKADNIVNVQAGFQPAATTTTTATTATAVFNENWTEVLLLQGAETALLLSFEWRWSEADRCFTLTATVNESSPTAAPPILRATITATTTTADPLHQTLQWSVSDSANQVPTTTTTTTATRVGSGLVGQAAWGFDCDEIECSNNWRIAEILIIATTTTTTTTTTASSSLDTDIDGAYRHFHVRHQLVREHTAKSSHMIPLTNFKTTTTETNAETPTLTTNAKASPQTREATKTPTTTSTVPPTLTSTTTTIPVFKKESSLPKSKPKHKYNQGALPEEARSLYSRCLPIEGHPIDAFVPPADASQESLLLWQKALKEMTARLQQFNKGGAPLKELLLSEAKRLQTLRDQLFCHQLTTTTTTTTT